MLNFIEQKTRTECGISEQLTLMKRTIDNLTGTITEMHQLAQSQENMVPLHFQEVNLCDIIDEVIHDIHLLAVNCQIEITFDGRGRKDGLISVDADKLCRALFELIQNAVKFTPDVGLSLAKNLVETHGGSISLVSDYDNGSNFSIFLPCREAHPSR